MINRSLLLLTDYNPAFKSLSDEGTNLWCSEVSIMFHEPSIKTAALQRRKENSLCFMNCDGYTAHPLDSHIEMNC